MDTPEFTTRPRSGITQNVRRLVFSRFGMTMIILVVAIAGSFVLGRYTVYKSHPDLTANDQANAILAKVGALIQLPTNETPNMATIKDAKTAKQGQPFLANAQNDDVLIVYPSAQTALLYRPSTNKLIAVGPVNSIGSSKTAQNNAPQPAAAAASQNETASSTDEE